MSNLVGKTVQSKTGDDIAIVESQTVKEVVIKSETQGTKKLTIHSFRRNYEILESAEVEEPQEDEQEDILCDTTQEGEVPEEETEEETAVETPAPRARRQRAVVEKTDVVAEEEAEEVSEDLEKAEKAVAKQKAPKKSEKKAVICETLTALRDDLIAFAENNGFESKPNMSYIAVRHQKKNIAEVYLTTKGFYMVVNAKAQSAEFNKQCMPFPEKYNWILNTKFIITADTLEQAQQALVDGAAFVDANKKQQSATKATKKKIAKKAVEELQEPEIEVEAPKKSTRKATVAEKAPATSRRRRAVAN